MTVKTVSETALIQNVLIHGDVVSMEGDYTVAEARAYLQANGILTNIGDATATYTDASQSTIEFGNTRGQNGIK